MRFLSGLAAALFMLGLLAAVIALAVIALFFAVDVYGLTFLWGFATPFVLMIAGLIAGLAITAGLGERLEDTASPVLSGFGAALARVAESDRTMKFGVGIGLLLALGVAVEMGEMESPFAPVRALYAEHVLGPPRYDEKTVQTALAAWDSRDWSREAEAEHFPLEPAGGGWQMLGAGPRYGDQPHYCFELVNRSGGLLVAATVAVKVGAERAELPLRLGRSPVSILERREVCAELYASRDLKTAAHRKLYELITGDGRAPEPEARLVSFKLRPVDRKKELNSWLDQAVSQ
jgi:hypothetical protein